MKTHRCTNIQQKDLHTEKLRESLQLVDIKKTIFKAKKSKDESKTKINVMYISQFFRAKLDGERQAMT